MPKRRFPKLLALALSLALSLAVLSGIIAGPATAQHTLYNAVNSPLPAPRGVTMREIGSAIISAGARRGWIIRSGRAGELIGTLHLRSHVAVVAIKYSLSKFSITYRRSTNLRYRKEGQFEYIQPNYNRWIRYLERDIIQAAGRLQAAR